MKKRALLILALVICLLFSGFTRVECDTPSLFFGSEDTVFGDFTVPVPDYYTLNGDHYEYCEKKKTVAAALYIETVDAGSMSLSTFNNKKESALDSMISNATRISAAECSVAGCPGITGDYRNSDGDTYRAVLVFHESGKQLLCLRCGMAKNAGYDGYFDDFTDMVNAITLTGTASAPTAGTKSASAGGVSKETKEFWDSYEAFVDEYVAFMQKYMKNPYDFTLLAKLSDYMTKLSDFEAKADAYDNQSDYSDADLAYALEVSARVLSKLAKVL